MSSARPHILEEELHAYCDGELSPPQRMEIAEHLLGCLICRAQHAEVDALRGRATALLDLAAPPGVRRPVPVPGVSAPTRRHEAPRIAAAVAAAVIGAGMWFSLRPDTSPAGSQLATSFLTPALIPSSAAATDPGGQRARQMVLISRMVGVPGVLPTRLAPPAAPLPRTIEAAAVDPVLGDDWPEAPWDSALKAGLGSVARIAGLSVTSVRTNRSTGNLGGRPNFLVRQQLADGRSVWVYEGLLQDFTAISQLLEASGINVSLVRITRPDYVITAQSGPTRTTRLAAVAGYLPADSLNQLMSKIDFSVAQEK